MLDVLSSLSLLSSVGGEESPAHRKADLAGHHEEVPQEQALPTLRVEDGAHKEAACAAQCALHLHLVQAQEDSAAAGIVCLALSLPLSNSNESRGETDEGLTSPHVLCWVSLRL